MPSCRYIESEALGRVIGLLLLFDLWFWYTGKLRSLFYILKGQYFTSSLSVFSPFSLPSFSLPSTKLWPGLIRLYLKFIRSTSMAPQSSALAWRIPWMEEPGRLQSMGSPVGHNWATSLSLLTFVHWRRQWQPTPVFLPGVSQGWGAWWAAVYGVAQSRTQLKRLSSSSSHRSTLEVTSLASFLYDALADSVLSSILKNI